jgi:Helix-turn-helix domain
MPHSITSVDTVLAKSQAKGAARFLLTVIAHHMNAGGYAWPSVATLCRETGFGKRYVLRLLDTLTASKELGVQVRQGPSGANLYCLGGLLATTPHPPTDRVVVYSSDLVVYGSDDESHVVADRPPEGKALEGTEDEAGSLARPIHQILRWQNATYGWCEHCHTLTQPGPCLALSKEILCTIVHKVENSG